MVENLWAEGRRNMELNAEFCAGRLSCTREEKEACLETLKKLYRYGRTARMQGLLALENAIEEEINPLLREGLKHVVDSQEPEEVRNVLLALTLADDRRGGSFLDAVLVMEGMRMLQMGVNPYFMVEALAGWFGTDFMEECTRAIRQWKQGAWEQDRISLKLPEAPAQCAAPEFQIFLNVPDPSVQQFLRELDPWELAHALLDATEAVRKKLLRNMSLRRRSLIEEIMAYVAIRNTPDVSRESQKRILQTGRRKQWDGEAFVIGPSFSKRQGGKTVKLEVFFDYLCEFCEIGHHHYLMELLPHYPHIEPVWRPCEAHPRTDEPGYGRHSDLAIQGLFFVQEHGGSTGVYNDCLYDAVYRRGENIEDPDVLARYVKEAQADPEIFRHALDSHAYEKKQQEANAYAYGEMRVKAIPTFVLGNGNRVDAILGIGVAKNQLADLLDSAL